MKSLCFILVVLCNSTNIVHAMNNPNNNLPFNSSTRIAQQVNNGIYRKRSYDDCYVYSKPEFFPPLNLVKQTLKEIQSKNDINACGSSAVCSDQRNIKRRKLSEDLKSKSGQLNTKTYSLSNDPRISMLMSDISKLNLKLFESNFKLEKLQNNNKEITMENVQIKRHLNYVLDQFEKIQFENHLLRRNFKELRNQFKELKECLKRDPRLNQNSVRRVVVLNARNSKINVENIFN